MIAIGVALAESKDDIAAIVKHAQAIIARLPKLEPGNVIALDDIVEDEVNKIGAEMEAAGLLDDFTKNRPLLSAILKSLLQAWMSGALPFSAAE